MLLPFILQDGGPSLDLGPLRLSWYGLRVAVLGEAMLDVYLDGAVRRFCPEAPVPVVALAGRTEIPGGAANTVVTRDDSVAPFICYRVTFVGSLAGTGVGGVGAQPHRAAEQTIAIPSAYPVVLMNIPLLLCRN